ncbi:MAG: ferritin-like domain-containing protein [Nitrospira sp.]|nr:ferritin-like domain-containing protein [Candidatus Manganitrophaceae bacterium]HIL34724.1 ferritin-like domain-containing protein [Candidatus Manganitrophaceae bacterium]
MDSQAMISLLNSAISLEYGGAIQYSQNSVLLQGTYREVHSGFFGDMSNDSFSHARKLGIYVVGLGGIPTVEPAPIKQTTDLTEMLEFGLEIETAALATYTQGVEMAEDNVPFRVMLEDMTLEEYNHQLGLKKILGKLSLQVSDAIKEVRLKQA